MKLTRTAGLLAAAMFVPVPVLAGVSDGIPAFGIAAADIGVGAIAGPDRIATADEASLGADGAITLHGFRLAGDRTALSAATLIVAPDGGLILSDGMISSSVQGRGEVRFASAQASSADLVVLAMDGRVCDPLGDSADAGATGALHFSDVTLTSPADGVTGNVTGPEKVTASGIAMGLVTGSGGHCFDVASLHAADIAIAAADGAIGRIAEISAQSVTMPAEGGAVSGKAAISGISAVDAGGKEVLRIASASVDYHADLAMMRKIDLIDHSELGEGAIPEVVVALASGDFGISYRMDGIHVAAGDFLSAPLRERIGSDGSESFSGWMSFAIDSPGEQLNVSAAMDMDGLAEGGFNLGLVMTPESGGANLSAMMGGHDGAAFLSHLRLASASASVTDKGAWRMIEAATGRSPAEHVVELKPMASMAPAEIAGPVLRWMTGVAENGHGKAAAQPSAPVGLVEIGMAAMLNPGGLGALLNVSAE
ncbi:hypothetical protein [Defluviimonas salinarum]|uniref:Uncharacterized protein n=1 Tax=Defluviimonas salinarum TaxID=2992147 RepID=A0ABT3J4I9_9RHOB|nr:hypothetical protein [Defluviimonas salinarum]MCW3782602.1 hypothetical protein [Defluviimonas salinarum]